MDQAEDRTEAPCMEPERRILQEEALWDIFQDRERMDEASGRNWEKGQDGSLEPGNRAGYPGGLRLVSWRLPWPGEPETICGAGDVRYFPEL